MPSFSLTPLTDVPPPAQEDFPNFIQFQNAGTDLGTPDADTLNFSTGLTATRGTGENVNVVTVTSDGVVSTLQVQEDGVNLGAADVDTLNFSTGIEATRGSDRTVTLTVASGITASMLQLDSPPDPPIGEMFLFDGTPYVNFWADIPLISSAEWEWVIGVGTMELRFLTAGRYRITATCTIEAATEWPNGATTYGSTVVGVSTSAQARSHTTGDLSDTRTSMQWTDQHFVVANANDSYGIGLYALATDTAHVVQTSQMVIAIERFSDV